jgi:predicted acetyltransferase
VSGTGDDGVRGVDRLQLRPIDIEELPAFADEAGRAFGEEGSETSLASLHARFEADRSLAAFAPDGRIVATSGAYSFDLALPGGLTAPCAGISYVGVRQDHRRRGLLSRMMRRLMRDARERGEPFAALWASEGAIYGRYGFGPAIPHLQVEVPRHQLVLRDPVTTSGVELVTDADDALRRLPALYARVRERRPGSLSRNDAWWHHLVVHDPTDQRDGAGPRNIAVLPEGGYVLYRLKPRWNDGTPDGTVKVEELVSLHPDATAALWSFLATTDLATTVLAVARPVDEPLPSMLVDPSQARVRSFPPVWLRILDVTAALEARGYHVDGRIAFHLDDPLYPELSGSYDLEVVDGRARCVATTGSVQLHLGMEELSAVVLGGVSTRMLLQARRVVEDEPGAADRFDRLLGGPMAPYQPSEF